MRVRLASSCVLLLAVLACDGGPISDFPHAGGEPGPSAGSGDMSGGGGATGGGATGGGVASAGADAGAGAPQVIEDAGMPKDEPGCNADASTAAIDGGVDADAALDAGALGSDGGAGDAGFDGGPSDAGDASHLGVIDAASDAASGPDATAGDAGGPDAGDPDARVAAADPDAATDAQGPEMADAQAVVPCSM